MRWKLDDVTHPRNFAHFGRRGALLALGLAASVGLAGCFNMPTQPSEITGAYTSTVPYESQTCAQLSTGMNSLARREDDLVIAQQQRIKSSKVQAFWLGYGQGDGIAAAELANVRGEREAVRTAMDEKKCQGAPPAAPLVEAASAPAQR